jgi:NADP-dependent 3-hydroxy acid dehydrogenase YdfG
MTSLDFEGLFSLRGKTAMVTGASSGIGLHVAQLFASAGASVALAARRLDRTQAAAQALRDAGHRACAVPLDLLDDASVAPAFDEAELSWERRSTCCSTTRGCCIRGASWSRT